MKLIPLILDRISSFRWVIYRASIFLLFQAIGAFLIVQHLHLVAVQEGAVSELKLQQRNLVLKEALLSSIAIADNSIEVVKREIGSREFNDEWESHSRYSFLKGYINNTVPMLLSFSIYDEKGELYATSFNYPFKKVNISDRGYFKEIAAGDDPLFVGPYFGWEIDKWYYSVIRKFYNRDGSFRGILVGVIDLDYFSTFCQNTSSSEAVNTYIIGPTNLVITQCGYQKVVTSNIGKNFFEVTGDGQFKNVTLSSDTTSLVSDKWLLLVSSIPSHFGLRISTLVLRDSKLSLDNNWQQGLIYSVLLLVFVLCFVLYVNALLLAHSYKKELSYEYS